MIHDLRYAEQDICGTGMMINGTMDEWLEQKGRTGRVFTVLLPIFRSYFRQFFRFRILVVGFIEYPPSRDKMIF